MRRQPRVWVPKALVEIAFKWSRGRDGQHIHLCPTGLRQPRQDDPTRTVFGTLLATRASFVPPEIRIPDDLTRLERGQRHGLAFTSSRGRISLLAGGGVTRLLLGADARSVYAEVDSSDSQRETFEADLLPDIRATRTPRRPHLSTARTPSTASGRCSPLPPP